MGSANTSFSTNKENNSKYDRLLLCITEKALSCESLSSFLQSIADHISCLIPQGTLVFFSNDKQYPIMKGNPGLNLEALHQHMAAGEEPEGRIKMQGETFHYRKFGAPSHNGNFLAWVTKTGSAHHSEKRNELFHRLEEILEFHMHLNREISFDPQPIPTLYQVDDIQIIGLSPEIRRIAALAKKITPNPSSVLILGESGTGKELLARMIHQMSNRKRYVAFNCAGIPAAWEFIMEASLNQSTSALPGITGREI